MADNCEDGNNGRHQLDRVHFSLSVQEVTIDDGGLQRSTLRGALAENDSVAERG